MSHSCTCISSSLFSLPSLHFCYFSYYFAFAVSVFFFFFYFPSYFPLLLLFFSRFVPCCLHRSVLLVQVHHFSLPLRGHPHRLHLPDEHQGRHRAATGTPRPCMAARGAPGCLHRRRRCICRVNVAATAIRHYANSHTRDESRSFVSHCPILLFPLSINPSPGCRRLRLGLGQLIFCAIDA